MAAGYSVMPVQGIGNVAQGDDLAALLLRALDANGISLADGDVLAVAQKIVSKAEGRAVDLATVTPSAEAVALAAQTDKDPRLVQLILDESSEVVRRKPGVLIVRHKLGMVAAHAGIDQSNIDHGGGAAALLLPEDPDASAAALRRSIGDATGRRIGIVITDSANRPWRLGSVGIAIGAAGLAVLDDRRGGTDLYGRRLQATLVNLADGIATAATLAMGETAEGTPAALVRGLGALCAAGRSAAGSQRAAESIRPLAEDLFR